MHPPPTHPSISPSGKTTARLPARAEVDGSVRTTVTTAKGRSECASSPARRSESARRARESAAGWDISEGLHPVVAQELPDPGGFQRHVHVGHPLGGGGGDHGVDDRGRG